MARHYLKTIFGALAIFIFASPVSCLGVPTLTLEELEEQFQQLRDNHVRKLPYHFVLWAIQSKTFHCLIKYLYQIEMKINLEGKVTLLEEQMKLKEEQHVSFANSIF
jgi:hypothetical protein